MRYARCLFLSVSIMMLCFAHSATILHVKPDGTGDGSSWDNAAGLVAAVAQTKTLGGDVELYVAKGKYTPGAMSIAPGTTIYGGFTGTDPDETPATRDWKANKTIFFGNNSYWRDALNQNVVRNGKQVYLWADAETFNAPDPTEEELYWKPNYAIRLIDSTNEAVTGQKIVLDGILFTAASVSTAKNPLEVRNCRFWGVVNDFGIVYCKTSFTVENCEFIGCNGPAISSDGAETTDIVTVKKITVVGESTCNARGTIVYGANAQVVIEDCHFEKNFAVNTSSGWRSLVECTDHGKLTLYDTMFVSNVVDTASPCIVSLPNYTAATVSNCLFMCNQVLGDRGNNSTAAACILNARKPNHYVWGCSFISNVVDRTEEQTKSGVTMMPCSIVYSDYFAPIRNCTFDGNRVRAQASTDGVISISATWYVSNGTDTSCMFGNLFYKNDVSTGEIVMNRGNSSSGALQVFNSIFWNSSANYTPFYNIQNGKVGVHYSIVRNFEASDWATGYDGVKDINPKLDERLFEKLLLRRPRADSPARKSGIRLYFDSDAACHPVYQSGKYYVRCDTLGTGSVVAPYTEIPDARGNLARAGKKPDLGPVQWPMESGLKLLFQ